MEEKKSRATEEQQKILDSRAKNLVISASAGSGKTYILIEKLKNLICNQNVKVERLLVLTFTKVASQEMKTRLNNAILSLTPTKELIESLDSLPLSDISTIDSFCEKIIKRNINKLDLDENFIILDEKNAKNLKNIAFLSTYQHFARNFAEKFEEIYLAFKKNKSSFQECIFAIQDFCSSVNEEEERLDFFENHIAEINVLSQNRIKEFFESCQKRARQILVKAENLKLSNSEKVFVESLDNILCTSFGGDLFDVCQRLNCMVVPSLKGRHQDEVKSILLPAREEIKPMLDLAKKYQYLPKDAIKQAEEGSLVKAIFEFYHHYIDVYSSLKAKKSGLDFADIEKFAKKLLRDDEVKKSLQEKYDYIFIDEYQDTNKLQESILKPIAEGGFFTAVGDIKQGIYGFRNASMEIMQNDIENFSASDDGDALYLNGNFRTDERILNFVNIIFEKIMTKESVGIEYKEKSMLKGLKKFLKGELPPVCVDIVLDEKKDNIDKNENSLAVNGQTGTTLKDEKDFENLQNQQDRIEIYSVKDDCLERDDSLDSEINAIISRIEQVVGSQIYDAKLEKFRKAEMGDISLLFRGRSKLMQELVLRLRSLGIPVNADLKESLIEDSQIAVLNSLLKLTLNIKDDISLASVMCSPFGGFNIDEIAKIRFEGGDEKFFNLVLNSGDEKIARFKLLIENFKFDIQVFGVTKALCRLFNKYDFYEYLNSFDSKKEKISNINSLFKLIKGGNLDYNVSGLISVLENSSDVRGGEGFSNAITVTTIHATKGLEYPIVILCGAGDNLNKVYSKSFILSEKFGLGCSLFDFESMTRVPSPAFLAGRLELEAREFVDEIMIFYVALTRAQNHLYIVGKAKEKELATMSASYLNNYLKMILFAFGENFVSQLFSQGKICTENFEFKIVEDECGKGDFLEINNQNNKNNSVQKYSNEINQYLDFEYYLENECRLSFKNSVTGVMSHDQDLVNGHEHKNEYNADQQFERMSAREEAIMTGNAYHEALKLLDFDKIESMESLAEQSDFLQENMTNGYYEKLDFSLLYRNISLLKNLIMGKKAIKEKEFIMMTSTFEMNKLLEDCEESKRCEDEVDEKVCGQFDTNGERNMPYNEEDIKETDYLNILEGKSETTDQNRSINIINNNDIVSYKKINNSELNFENNLIVQGIVDLFALDGGNDEIILVDYKYTSSKDENVILSRYKKQLKLYALAIQKALGRQPDKCYILSLKEGRLIKVDLIK